MFKKIKTLKSHYHEKTAAKEKHRTRPLWAPAPLPEFIDVIIIMI